MKLAVITHEAEGRARSVQLVFVHGVFSCAKLWEPFFQPFDKVKAVLVGRVLDIDRLKERSCRAIWRERWGKAAGRQREGGEEDEAAAQPPPYPSPF